MGVTLSICSGTSIVIESIFENRFKYLDEIKRMGADVQVDGTTATIRGIDHLCGANVNALDLRAGAALCIAGLAAEGTTVVDDIHYIKRGYEKFDEKLRSLGGIIEEVDSERALQKARMRIG